MTTQPSGPSPRAQCILQMPPREHVTLPFCGTLQATPQYPQFFGSFSTLISQPLQCCHRSPSTHEYCRRCCTRRFCTSAGCEGHGSTSHHSCRSCSDLSRRRYMK